MTHSLKQDLNTRRNTFGAWITLGHPSIAEVFSHAGYPWVVIDNEHSMIAPEMIQTLIATSQAQGMAALVRVSHNHDSEIRKIMDAGADGVICPMINRREDAQRLVQAVKYPPMGQRTYGLSRAQGYGTRTEAYFLSSNEKSIVIAQIEHIDAVKNIQEILEVSGLDGVLTGPYDLSGSLKLPGQLTHPEVLRAEQTVLAACAQRGIACGAHLVHPTPEQIQAKLEMGYSYLALGTDFIFMGEAGKSALQEAKKRSQTR